MMTGPILLVEDDPDDEALTIRSLRKVKIANEILVARDGEEAIARLFDMGATIPSLVLLDLKLPKIDGVEVLRRIRESERICKLPVVVLTSSDNPGDLERCYEFHANSYVRKPVDIVRFTEAVAQIGFYWLLINQPPPEGAPP